MLVNSSCRCCVVSCAVVCGLLLVGCSGSLLPGRPDETGQVKLEVIDWAAFAEVLERNRGKVVLVDFWATWCAPCKELFPHTVELHKRFADKGLTVISVSLDDLDNQAEVLEFLIGKGATFDNFISRYGVGPELFEAFEIDAAPYFKLYDRQGRLYKSFSGGAGPIDPKEIDRSIEELFNDE